MIKNYSDFVSTLQNAGFSMGGGNNEGIYSVISWNWNEQPPYDTPVRWHTGESETDPWEWRMRILNERNDVAYAKLFFKKSGYITKEWYPYFLAARRGGISFEEAYEDGVISQYAKRIYEVVSQYESLPLHEMKHMGGFCKEDKTKFDNALTELQMKMYLTMCGRQQKTSLQGETYGWASTVFCTTETFFGSKLFQKSLKVSAEEAAEKITNQIYQLNPLAQKKKIEKFIRG